MSHISERPVSDGGSGLSGSLKLIAALALIAFGILAALAVLDVVALEKLFDIVWKAVVLIAIAVLVTVGVGLLMRSR